MAIVRTDKECSLVLVVEVMTESFKNRIIQNINPAITDEQFYELANGFGNLQAHTVDRILRRDYSSLKQE